MRFDANLLIRLREDKLGGKSAAARKLHKVLVERGAPKPQEIDSLRKMIDRAEETGKPSSGSAWPVYLELLDLESQRPSIEAAMSTLGDLEAQISDVKATLAEIHAVLMEQNESFRGGKWIAEIGAGNIVRLDPAQILEIVEAVVGRPPGERYLDGRHVGPAAVKLVTEVRENAD